LILIISYLIFIVSFLLHEKWILCTYIIFYVLNFVYLKFIEWSSNPHTKFNPIEKQAHCLFIQVERCRTRVARAHNQIWLFFSKNREIYRYTYRENNMPTWKQRSEADGDQQLLSNNHKLGEAQNRFLLYSLQREPTVLTTWFWTYGLQNWEKINFYFSKSLRLWYFVMAALHTPILPIGISSLFFFRNEVLSSWPHSC
jgi:hypothetical protein